MSEMRSQNLNVIHFVCSLAESLCFLSCWFFPHIYAFETCILNELHTTGCKWNPWFFSFFFVPSMPPSRFALCLPFGWMLSDAKDFLATFSHEIKRPFVVAFKRPVRCNNQYSVIISTPSVAFHFRLGNPQYEGDGYGLQHFHYSASLGKLLLLNLKPWEKEEWGKEYSCSCLLLSWHILSALRIWQSSNAHLLLGLFLGTLQ